MPPPQHAASPTNHSAVPPAQQNAAPPSDPVDGWGRGGVCPAGVAVTGRSRWTGTTYSALPASFSRSAASCSSDARDPASEVATSDSPDALSAVALE